MSCRVSSSRVINGGGAPDIQRSNVERPRVQSASSPASVSVEDVGLTADIGCAVMLLVGVGVNFGPCDDATLTCMHLYR